MNKQDLRIVFMGTPDFAVPTLDAIIDANFNVVGVITAPDRKAGRGRKVKMSAIKEYALSKNLKVLQPVNLKDELFTKELESLKPNLQVVVAFRMLPKVVWSLPALGTFNLHASLLPQYRGAAPINFALINGETKTGVTTFFLDEKIDTGSIIDQKVVEIDKNDNVGSLHDKLMKIGSELVIETIDNILNNSIKLKDQNTYYSSSEELKSASKLQKEDCQINWSSTPQTIYNFVRGLSPYPCAYTKLNTPNNNLLPVKIFNVEIISHKRSNQPVGKILSDNKSFINVVVLEGIIGILELQLSGKKRMETEVFLRGTNNFSEYRLSI